MKKVVENHVVLLWASVYLLARNLTHAAHLVCKEIEPYIGMVSFAKMAAFISVSVIGFGLLGVLMACMK